MQSQAEKLVRKLAEDRSANYRGTVRARFEYLEFDEEGLRETHQKDVERLIGVYETAAVCDPLDPDHRIPAIISQQNLDLAIRHTGTSLENLLTCSRKLPPELKFPPGYHLKCLHGQHRVEAAKQWGKLSPKDKWWAVDLYLADSSPELKKSLIEQYSNSANFSDGEIYLKIRHYQSEPNVFAEKRWWSYLSPSKRKDLKLFLKDVDLTAGYDALRPIRGLWGGLKIGTFQKGAALKCPEPTLHCLGHIWDVWSQILDADRVLMSLTDQATVETLQTRVPGLCSEDAKALESLMRAGALFPKLKDHRQRQSVWSNLMKVRCPIPTLYTLRKDILYLRPVVGIMKQILGYRPKRTSKNTLLETMEQRFTGVNQHEHQVQVQEAKFTLRPYRGNLEDRVNLGKWQAWLCLMRDFPDMVPECPKTEKGKPAPMPQKPKPAVWRRFATLMYRLGFESDEIHRLRLKDVDREKARDNLLEARDPEDYTYDDADFESHQDNMVKMYDTARKKEQLSANPLLFVDEPGESLERRCGRTFEDAYEYDRKHLFLNVLCDSDWVGGRGITSLFVRISVCFAFFGKPVFSTGTREVIEQGSDRRATDLSVAPPQPSGPSTNVRQDFQPAGTPFHNGPASSDTPQRNEVNESLPEELAALGRQIDGLRVQRATLEASIGERDQELVDLRAIQQPLSRDLENTRGELQKQSTVHERLEKTNEELEKRLSEAYSEADTLRPERDRLNADLTVTQSRLKELEMEKSRLEEDKAGIESNLRAQITRLEADKLALESCHEDAEKGLSEKYQGIKAEIDRLKAEEVERTAKAADLKRERQDLQAEVNYLKAEKSEIIVKVENLRKANQDLQERVTQLEAEDAGKTVKVDNLERERQDLQAEVNYLKAEKSEMMLEVENLRKANQDLQEKVTQLEAEKMETTVMVEDLEKVRRDLQSEMDATTAKHSREVEDLERLREMCQSMQNDLEKASGERGPVLEKLTRTEQELEGLREERKRMATVIQGQEMELGVLRTKAPAPAPAPTLEQPTSLAPEEKSAVDAPELDAPESEVGGTPPDEPNPSVEGMQTTISKSGEQRRIPAPAKRQSLLPPVSVEQQQIMPLTRRAEKSGRIVRVAKSPGQASGLQHSRTLHFTVAFVLIGKRMTLSVLTTVPFEREKVENLANTFWPEMQLFSSTGKGVLPRMCFDTLIQDNARTIYLWKRGPQIEVSPALINAGIPEDARTDEGERVVEIESENEEPVQPEPDQLRKRKLSIHDDVQRSPTDDREQKETSMVRYKRAKRALE